MTGDSTLVRNSRRQECAQLFCHVIKPLSLAQEAAQRTTAFSTWCK